MDPIKLLDVANPKKIKDTVNLLIENYENFGNTVQAIVDKAAEDSAAALIAGEAAKQIAEESAEALEEAIASQNTTIENAIAAQDAIIAQNTTTSNSAKQIAEEALVMIEQADARSEAATATAEDALDLANEAISTSELAMNVATEAKSTVDQAISTGVFGTFVHNTAGISLLHAYMTDNLNQENTDENFYMATPKLVRDALSNISAGNLLIGTEDNPIILSTDIEDGKSYLISGYFKMCPSTSDSFIYHFAETSGGSIAQCIGIGTNPQGYKLIEIHGWAITDVSAATKEVPIRAANYIERITFSPFEDSYSATSYIGLQRINYKDNVDYIWAPTSGGTAGQILQSNGNNNAPTWIDNITIDTELSETSTNPVQNNIITTKLQQIEELIPTTLSELTEDTTHRLVTDTEKATWNSKSEFSGSYNDLTNKPAIPTTLSELSEDSTHRLVTDAEKSTWNAKSEFSGSYNDLTDKPTIPTDNSQLTNGAGYVTQTEVNTSVATKTAVNVNGALQQTLNFDSDPQTQLDNKVNKEGAEFVDDVLFTSSSNNNKIRLQLNSASPIGIPRISFSKGTSSYFLGIRTNDQNINCLYVNTAFWADFIYTQSLKSTVDGRDLTKLHADYDSGWFDFSAATTYTFTHNLGTTEFYTLIDMRYNGSGPLYTQNTMINSDGQSNSYAGGINETYRTTTQIWLRGAKNYAMQFSSAANTEGYYTDRSLNNNCQARVRLFKIV